MVLLVDGQQPGGQQKAVSLVKEHHGTGALKTHTTHVGSGSLRSVPAAPARENFP
ncbi:hypothetical protein [Phytohabitans rumicis]|nr:hypothetical protein [Phytohabitans rumicis]